MNSETRIDLRNIIRQDYREETAPGSVSRFGKFSSRKIGDRDKSEFCTQLSVLLQARISIQRALQSLSRQTKNTKLMEVIDGLVVEIQSGASFAKSLTWY